MADKIISQLDADGYFVGPVLADESPLEPGVFLIPAGAVDRAPPAVIDPAKRYRTWGAGWRGEDRPAPEVPAEPVPPTAAELRRAGIIGRLAAIDAESIRALRVSAVESGKGRPEPAFEKGKLESLETEAAALRAELAGL